MKEIKKIFKCFDKITLLLLFALVLINSFQFGLFAHSDSLSENINHKYSTLQTKYSGIALIQTRRDEIMFLGGMGTAQSKIILDSIVFAEFYAQDSKGTTKKYKDGQIDPSTYWYSVLHFYESLYTQLGEEIRTDILDIENLKGQINFLDWVALIYSMFAISLNILLTILLTIRLERRLSS